MSSTQNSLFEKTYKIIRYHADASVILAALFPTVYAFGSEGIYSIFVGVSFAGMILAFFIIALRKAIFVALEIIMVDIYRVTSSRFMRDFLIITYAILYLGVLIIIFNATLPFYVRMVYIYIASGGSIPAVESGVSQLSLLTPLLFITLSIAPISFLILLRGVEWAERARGRY